MKKLMILFVGILLVGTVIAVGVSVRNRNLEVSEKSKRILDRIGLTDYNVNDTNIGTEVIERCLSYSDILNSCKVFDKFYNNCSVLSGECNKVYYTDAELLTIMDRWEDNRINQVAQRYDTNINRTRTPERTGKTTIKEKADKI